MFYFFMCPISFYNEPAENIYLLFRIYSAEGNTYPLIVQRIGRSTRPVRGATGQRRCTDSVQEFQSTRPVRGATRPSYNTPVMAMFQSTHPVRGATSHSP